MKNHDFSIDEIDYLDFLDALEKKAGKFKLLTVKCNNCGATSTIDTSTEASSCPSCADALEIGAISEDAVISPWGMVPFEIEAYKAKEVIKLKLSKRWFKPIGLDARSLLSNHFQAVYIPFWTFDCDMTLKYAGKRGDEVDHEDRVAVLWTEVTGDIEYFFDDILVAAAGNSRNDSIKALSPWNIQKVVPFKQKNLKGAVVEKCQVDVKQGMDAAKQKIFDAAELFIKTDIGGEVQLIEWVNANYKGITFKHILLPIYTATYKFKGKSYPLVVDGQRGNFSGKIPRSITKIVALILVVLIVILGLGWLIQNDYL